MSADDFLSLYGTPPTTRAHAPGRVNLIGEHTDYNDGFVLPMPIPQETYVELAPRNDELVRGYSAEYAQVEDARREKQPRVQSYRLGAETKVGTWLDYIQGMTVAIQKDGHKLSGFDLRLTSEVPVGGGLSSSAALEISVLRALRTAFQLPLDDMELARIGQRAENDFVGAPSGLMDQIVVSVGRKFYALFLDTRSLEHWLINLPEGANLVVISSGIRHSHAAGEYRVRRQECEEAARLLGVPKLRDIGADAASLARIAQLPEPYSKRARHVVTENERVLDAVRAIAASDLVRFGQLLRTAHASMRDDFEASVPEIDMLVDLANAQPDVFGARLTGGGFGGAIVAVTKAGTGAAVARKVAEEYDRRTQRHARVLLPAA